MPKRTDIKPIQDYAFFKKLTALPFVEAIYLYGSRARGDGLSRSDIDLAVFCPSANVTDWSMVRDIVEQADTLLKIDCLRYDEVKNSQLLAEINRDKVSLYER